VYVPLLETEAEKIEGWRLRCLIEGGYPVPIAEHLAKDLGVDYHRALELLGNGCPPDLAREILT